MQVFTFTLHLLGSGVREHARRSYQRFGAQRAALPAAIDETGPRVVFNASYGCTCST